jgi:galactokinase
VITSDAASYAGETRVWRAPGRVNLIGEHTDYNDGFALPLAITQGCTATVTVRADAELHIRSAQEDDVTAVALGELSPDLVGGWAAYVAGVIWALQRRGVNVPGLDVAVDGDVPLGAGLSSSAALSCSVTTALDDLLDLGLTSADQVSIARTAENDFVGAPTGGMDQLASIRGATGHVLLCDMRSLDTRAVPMDLAGPGLALLVTNTQAPHRNADGEYRERRESCERAAAFLGVRTLREVQDDDHAAVLDRLRTAAAADANADPELLVRRARHILTENDRVLQVVAGLDDGDVPGIGPRLTESHVSMRDDFEITVPEVDAAVDAALGAGALGARMTGGGFGGCVIALIAASDVETAQTAITQAFEQRSFTAPVFFVTQPSAGAHRISS